MNHSHEAATIAKPRPVTKQKRPPHSLQGGSGEANRLAVVILEVLAGGRTPSDAAVALGVTAPRYYQLETRALQGLVDALESRPKGKQPSLEVRIRQLESSLQEARRESLRQQALVRAAQRSLGIKPPAVVEGKAPGKDAAGRRKRRPVVRALRAVRNLTAATGSQEAEAVKHAEATGRPVSSAAEDNGPASGGTQAES
jgi:hypothetical protein